MLLSPQREPLPGFLTSIEGWRRDGELIPTRFSSCYSLLTLSQIIFWQGSVLGPARSSAMQSELVLSFSAAAFRFGFLKLQYLLHIFSPSNFVFCNFLLFLFL